MFQIFTFTFQTNNLLKSDIMLVAGDPTEKRRGFRLGFDKFTLFSWLLETFLLGGFITVYLRKCSLSVAQDVFPA